MGEAIGSDLGLRGMLVKYVTTDGDGKSAAGVKKAMKAIDPLLEEIRLADPVHLGRSQFKRCNSGAFSEDMFNARTRKESRQQQLHLSRDVKARCSLIIGELMRIHDRDTNKIKKHIPKVLQATMKCYDGDCSMCRAHSLVCGGGETNNWWFRSAFLGPVKIHSLNMNDTDRYLLEEVLKMKLSEAALEKTKLNTTTQKCESFNRTLGASLPKNVNYSRNHRGRASAAIHRSNNSKATSLEAKLTRVGATVSKGTKRRLDAMDDRERVT